MTASHRSAGNARPLILLLLAASVLVVTCAALLAPAAPAFARSGDLVWTHSEDSPSHDLESIIAAAPGPNGAMYAAGNWASDWPGTYSDGSTLRFRTTVGTSDPLTWLRVYDDPDYHAYDSLRFLTTDPSRNAVVAGESVTGDGHDWLLIKWLRSGAQAWSLSWGQGLGRDEIMAAVTCDADGNVYACGLQVVGKGDTDLLVGKFRASDGKPLWRQRYSGPGPAVSRNQAEALAVGKDGALYVVGSGDSTGGDMDVLVMRLSRRSGKVVWLRRLDAGAHRDETAGALVVNDTGVFVAGEAESATLTKVLLARYTTAGRRKLLRTWRPQVAGALADVHGLGVDASGNAYVAGTWSQGDPIAQGLLVSWTQGGRLRWGKTYFDRVSRDPVWFTSLVVDAKGTAWAAGADGSDSSQDGLLVRYRSDGRRTWVRTYDGEHHNEDWFNTLRLWGTGHLFAGGTVTTATGGYDILAARYVR